MSRSLMTMLSPNLAAAASFLRSAGLRTRLSASSRAWLRASMAALRRLFRNQRMPGIAKNAVAYA